jgi:hypothetical protein
MARGTKNRKYVGPLIRQIAAKNLEDRLRRRYGEKKNHPRRFEEEFGVNFSSVQRVLDGQGCAIDYLELFANKLGISAYELLIPPPEMQRMMHVSEPIAAATGKPHEPMVRATDVSKEPTQAPRTRRITK